jgi:glycosyltransferase involved in cell wall biosynthesis
VGGTNPSLVEALGAGSPVLAHDNRFNRWVAGEGAAYFEDEDGCARAFDELLGDDARLERMRRGSYCRHAENFTQERVLGTYETLLARWVAGRPAAAGES